MLVDDLIDHPVFLGLLRVHNVISLDVFFDAVDRLAGMFRQQRVDGRAHAQDFFCVNVDVRGLPAQPRQPRLVNQDARVRQGKALLRSAPGQQHCGNRGRLPDAGCHHVRLHKLHCVIYRESRGDRATRRIDIQLNVFLRVFRLQEQHLRGRQVGDVIVDWRADKNDVLFQQPGIDIIRPFAAAGLFDHHRYEGRGTVIRFVEFSHGSKPLAPGRKISLCVRRRICRRDGLDSRALLDPLECLIASQLGLHPIERSLLCQTCTQRFRRFATMRAQVFKFARNVVLRHVNVFRGGDAVDDQLRFHVIPGAVFLAAPQRHPVHVHRARVHALCCQRAHHALQPHVHLMLHQRFRHREVVLLHQFRQNSFVKQFLVPVVALVLQPFADFLFQLLEGLRLAHVLREIIVQLRQLLCLDPQYLYGVMKFLPGKLWVGIIGRILHIKILVVAYIRGLQIRIEGLHRFFRANVAQHAVRLERIPAAFRRAEQLHLREVTVLDGPTFDRCKRRRPLAHLLQGLLYVILGDVHGGHFQFQPLVTAQVEFRHHFEDRAKLQRLSFVEVQLVHFRLGNRRQLLFRYGLFHALWNQRLQHFPLYVFRESPPDQRDGGFSAPESRNRRQPRELFCHALDLLRYFLGGNFQFQLAAAACLSHKTVLSSNVNQPAPELSRLLTVPRRRSRNFTPRRSPKRTLTFGRDETGENSPYNLNTQYRRRSRQGQIQPLCFLSRLPAIRTVKSIMLCQLAERTAASFSCHSFSCPSGLPSKSASMGKLRKTDPPTLEQWCALALCARRVQSRTGKTERKGKPLQIPRNSPSLAWRLK